MEEVDEWSNWSRQMGLQAVRKRWDEVKDRWRNWSGSVSIVRQSIEHYKVRGG